VYRALDHKQANVITRDGFDLLKHWDPSLPNAIHNKFDAKTLTRNQDDPKLDLNNSDELVTFQVVLGQLEYAELQQRKAKSRADNDVPKLAGDQDSLQSLLAFT